jgi:hypothetical protein
MSENLVRTIHELAGDCRIDREDAVSILDTLPEDPSVAGPTRRRLLRLMQRCAPRMDPEALGMMKSVLSREGEAFGLPDRVLLGPGDSGEEVRELRAALGAAAGLLGDRSVDPGGGDRFDAATASGLRAFQMWWGREPDGRLDSRTLRILNFTLRETDHPQLDPERIPAKASGVELHFYPGARTLEVLRKGEVIDRYDMRGGPEEIRPDNRPGIDGRHRWGPTPRGRYRIRSLGRHVSRTWKYSQIPWGARIRERDGVVQFQSREGVPWRDATGPGSVFRNQPEALRFERADFLGDGGIVPRWEKNDFGHITAYLERGGRIQNHMIHATPAGERRYGDDAFPLTKSHGCEHLRPHDLDEMRAKGYLRPGVPFVVHGYDERP